MAYKDPAKEKQYQAEWYQSHRAHKAQYQRDRFAKNPQKCWEAVLRYRESDPWRARLAEIKIASGCIDCGFNGHPAALEFDHLPQFEKSFTISAARKGSYTWEQIEEEIAKCEIVCSNCHRIRTVERAAMRRQAIIDRAVAAS